MSKALGYAAVDQDAPMAPYEFERRDLRPNDVSIKILYTGVCHSDLHQARNDWHNTIYPCIPGHEIVGEVTAVGSGVTKHEVGDKVAVGTIVDSCQECDPCHEGMEIFCKKGATGTYNSKDRQTGELTFGGYSDHIVTREEFVLKLPDALDITKAAPLLCAGITLWSPLTHWNVGEGTKVAIVGLGGLGHMGVKLAVGLGADVTVVTTSPEKADDARALGAHNVLISKDEDAMKQAMSSFDLVIDTIPVAHDIAPYLMLVGREGTLVQVGSIDMIPSFHSGLLMMGRRSVASSAVGGTKETQEMLDFCAEKGIHPDCEMIRMDEINEAWERMVNGDVKYRFVIDMGTLGQG